MTWLTTSELTSLRSAFSATLPDTCEIQSVTETQSARGAITKSWAARGTAIACRISPYVGTQFPQFIAEAASERRLWVLSVAYNQEMAATDRVIHGGATYQVKQVNYGSESESLLTRALLEAEQPT